MIVVFDAQCLLCNGWVHFLLKHDHRGVFQFASIQGETGRALLDKAGLSVAGLQTLVLRQFHCDFSLTARQSNFSKLPQAR